MMLGQCMLPVIASDMVNRKPIPIYLKPTHKQTDVASAHHNTWVWGVDTPSTAACCILCTIAIFSHTHLLTIVETIDHC